MSSVHLSDEWFEELRTGAVRGLGSHASGMSPLIHLSLIEHPAADPGFFAMAKTISDVRSFVPREACCRILTELCQPATKLNLEPGPAHVLFQRLLQIGWHWNPALGFVDLKGWPIDIWECPIQELMLRLVEGWQNRVQHNLSKRKTFKGLWKCNPALTKRGWPKDRIDQGVLRTALNGTFFTADHLKYLPGELSQQCPFCGQPDSQLHRHWKCQKLSQARQHCDEPTRDLILSMDPAVYNHGWIPNPESLDKFRQCLIEIQNQTGEFHLPPVLPEHFHIFTDGSCLDPQDHFTRLAAWGMTIGTFDQPFDFFPVARGLIPGLIQTSARAELTAAIAALKLVARFQRPFTLWIDNDFVVQTLHKFASPRCEIPLSKTPNHDLLQELFTWYNFVRHLTPEVVKVCSHQDLNKIVDPIEAWVIRGNNSADETAGRAYCSFPEVMQVRSQLVQEISFLENLKKVLHSTLINVGNMAMDLLKAQRKGTHSNDAGRDCVVDPKIMEEWRWPSTAELVKPKFRLLSWPLIVQWNASLHSTTETVKFWNWSQLVVDFGIQTKLLAPWYCRSSKRWKTSTDCPRSPLSKRSRWFKTFAVKVFEQAGLPFQMTTQKPDSYAIHFWGHCLPVQVSDARSRLVDEWLIARRSNYLKSKDMQTIWDVP